MQLCFSQTDSYRGHQGRPLHTPGAQTEKCAQTEVTGSWLSDSLSPSITGLEGAREEEKRGNSKERGLRGPRSSAPRWLQAQFCLTDQMLPAQCRNTQYCFLSHRKFSSKKANIHVPTRNVENPQ